MLSDCIDTSSLLAISAPLTEVSTDLFCVPVAGHIHRFKKAKDRQKLCQTKSVTKRTG